MIIVMKNDAKYEEIQTLKQRVQELGYTPHVIQGLERTVIGCVGNQNNKERLKALITLPGVENIMPVLQPYKLASSATKKEPSVIEADGIKIGGGYFTMMAGPCSVENREQTFAAARVVKEEGGQFLRGGAYKPRTSPYSFQGLEEEGLEILLAAKKEFGVKIVTELVNPQHTELVAQYTDIIQIGARNMQNFALLREVGKLRKPILLKRGLAATLEELLMSAEYIMSEGNYNVILCERGIRTFETAYRNTLDLNAIPALKKMTHLPVIVDPSHGTGRRDLILSMSKAAVAAGADGLIIEIHPDPEKALSDGPQSLTLDEFRLLMKEIKPYVHLGRKTLSS